MYRRPHSGCDVASRGEARPTMLRSVNTGPRRLLAGGRVAAMPSVGLKMKLSVLGVAFAALGVSTSTASASDVWLWACHGPSGSPINSFGSNNFSAYDGGCTQNGGTLDTGGLRGRLTPAGGMIDRNAASANLTVPPSTKLVGLRVQRRVSGVPAGVTYSLKAPSNAVTLESSS